MTVVQAFFPKSSMVYDSPQYCKHERVKKKKRYSSAFTSLEVGSGIVILVIMFYVQWHIPREVFGHFWVVNNPKFPLCRTSTPLTERINDKYTTDGKS